METQPLTTSLQDAAYTKLIGSEGHGNYIYGDYKGIPTIGTGIALVIKENGEWKRLGDEQLNPLFSSMGIQAQATKELKDALEAAARALDVGNGTTTANFTTFPKLANITDATAPFGVRLDDTQIRQSFDWKYDQAITDIPSLRHDPKFGWVYDAKIVCDSIAKGVPLGGDVIAQEAEDSVAESPIGRVALVVCDGLVHRAP